VNTNNLTTTSFRIDCSDLVVLQKRANELGFKSWGAFVRHVIDCHVMFFEPDLLARLSGTLPPNRPEGASGNQNRSTGHFRSKKQHP
jgi:hypothetical protein